MHEYIQYENKKKELKKYFERLDNKCKAHFGPLNKYVYPVDNPYNRYYDLEDFKKKVLKEDTEDRYIKRKESCKFLRTASTNMDKNMRYYTDANTKEECDILEGEWTPKTINRANKFDNGVCWVSEQDKKCGSQLTSVDMLRSYRGMYNPEMSKYIIEEANKCKIIPGCAWEQQTAYTYDCVAAKDAEKEEGPVEVPPEDMPLIDFEAYLEEWYIKNKHGAAPKTTELFGKGDRCKNQPIEEEEGALPPPPPEKEPYVSYRSLNLTNPRDLEVVKNAVEKYYKYPKDALDLLKSAWLKKKKMSEVAYKKYWDDEDPLEVFYKKMDIVQFQKDYRIGKRPEGAEKPKQKLYPSIPQSVVNMVMKNVAIKKSKKRGMLAWVSTGGGKSCIAAGVMDAFWDSDYQIIFASSIDGVASNPDFVFHQCLLNLFARFQKEPYKGATDAQSLALISAAFKKRRIRFLSFAKLANRVMKAIEYKKQHGLDGYGAAKKKGGNVIKEKKEKTHDEILAGDDYVDLDKTILIVDEVHTLFAPLPNQKKQHEFLEAELVDPKKHPNLKIVILSATPGSNIPDVLKLLNIVRDANAPEIKPFDMNKPDTIDRFRQSIRGMISYLDMSADDTRFPKVIDSQPVKLPMSQSQFEKYVDAYKAVKATQKDFKALSKKNEVGKYWEPARKYANMLFSFAKDMKLEDFSSKLPYVVEKILSVPNAKHYLYSAFGSKAGYGGHGVIAVAKELEKHGYVKLSIQEAKKLNKAGKLPIPAKRYILVINTELGEESGNAGANLHELIKIYNHPENKNGELIHIMLASNKYNESLDLKAVQEIHLLDSLVTMAAEKQAIGRAVRFCSFAQKDRSKGEWVVKINRYMSDKPESIVVDLGSKREKIQQDIAAIEHQIEEAGNKDMLKEAKKATKDKEKEILKIEKLVAKGKATEEDVRALKDELKDLEKNLALAEKGMGDNKDAIANLKAQLKDKNKELKALDKPPKNNPNDVEMIEERIQKEAEERFKELFTVYQCMKQSAVDCRILKEFHEKTAGQKITCV